MDVEDDDLPFPEFPSEARLRAETHTHHRTRLLLSIIANAPHITRYTLATTAGQGMGFAPSATKHG